MKKIFILILVMVLFTTRVISQGFEGQITYSININGGSVNLPDTSLNLIEDNLQQIVYTIKNNNFKSVTSKVKSDTLYKTINLYNPKTKGIYYYTNEKNGICMIENAKTKAKKYDIKIIRDTNDTKVIMGKECSLVSLNYKTGTIKLYYSEMYKVDTTVLKDDKYMILNYLYVCGAIPLKIEIINYNWIYNLEYTITKIDEKLIDNKVFNLPEDRQIITFPIKLPEE